MLLEVMAESLPRHVSVDVMLNMRDDYRKWAVVFFLPKLTRALSCRTMHYLDIHMYCPLLAFLQLLTTPDMFLARGQVPDLEQAFRGEPVPMIAEVAKIPILTKIGDYFVSEIYSDHDDYHRDEGQKKIISRFVQFSTCPGRYTNREREIDRGHGYMGEIEYQPLK
jgi:hypothetical protein